jgi:hypothetical protein
MLVLCVGNGLDIHILVILAGGDRVSWAKEWFSNGSRWSIRTDFDSDNKWPSPSDHVPRPTLGRPQITLHTAPSHTIGTRKEFSLVSKGW